MLAISATAVNAAYNCPVSSSLSSAADISNQFAFAAGFLPLLSSKNGGFPRAGEIDLNGLNAVTSCFIQKHHLLGEEI